MVVRVVSSVVVHERPRHARARSFYLWHFSVTFTKKLSLPRNSIEGKQIKGGKWSVPPPQMIQAHRENTTSKADSLASIRRYILCICDTYMMCQNLKDRADFGATNFQIEIFKLRFPHRNFHFDNSTLIIPVSWSPWNGVDVEALVDAVRDDSCGRLHMLSHSD
jgi:hypothetical protein